MRNYRATKGPFREQPFFKPPEIDNMCLDELERVGLLPSFPAPIRIDRFIEKRFGFSHEYEELSAGVMGYTRFGKTGVQAIVIDRNLDDGTLVNERRVRTTLAHEAGHALLHAHLFSVDGQCDLFPEGASATPRVLCRDVPDGSAKQYAGDWWEVQANMVIGSMLLPRPLVIQALRPLVKNEGGLSGLSLPPERLPEAADQLSDLFDVNRIVASIRLSALFPKEVAGQHSL